MVPAGKHQIEWRFEPKSYQRSNVLGTVGSLGLIIGFIVVLGITLKNAKPETEGEHQSK